MTRHKMQFSWMFSVKWHFFFFHLFHFHHCIFHIENQYASIHFPFSTFSILAPLTWTNSGTVIWLQGDFIFVIDSLATRWFNVNKLMNRLTRFDQMQNGSPRQTLRMLNYECKFDIRTRGLSSDYIHSR